MRRRGLEPPRENPPTRPSTLRVYQFRHRRESGAEYSSGTADASNGRVPSAGGVSCEHMFGSAPTAGTETVPMDLTKRQQEIFDFIKRYTAENGYPPTVRDIGKAVG